MASLTSLYSGKPGYETDFQSKMEKELVADLIGKYLFTDADFVRNLSAQNRNLFQRLFDEIKYLLRIVKAGSKEAKQLEKIKKVFEQAYQDTKNTAPSDGVQYSISKTSKMSYAEQLKLIEEGKLNGSNSLYAGEPSKALQETGFSGKPFAMNQGDYRKSRRSVAKNNNYSSHSVPFAFFQKMPAYLNESPILIDNGEKVTILTSYKMQDTKSKDSVVIAGIVRDQTMDADKVNQIKSVYPLDDCVSKITEAAKNGKLVAIDKNKAKEILASIGIQTSEQSRILSLAKEKLSQVEENVNPQLSLSEDTGVEQADGKNTYSQDVALEPAAQELPEVA